MKIPNWTKPAVLGAIAGAAAAIVIGFSVGGRQTGGGVKALEEASAKSAIVQTFTALCVTQAQKAPEELAALMQQRRWDQDEFIVNAGWVEGVRSAYRTELARACATTLLEGMKTR